LQCMGRNSLLGVVVHQQAKEAIWILIHPSPS
jgi:hypothetical protein